MRQRLRLEISRERRKIDVGLRGLLAEMVSAREPWPLLLFGSAGAGKTCAALCLCDAVPTAAYLTVDELCDRIMEGDTGVFAWLASKELAVLDELGCREKVGDLHYTAVKQFADARQRKPTIYISNLAPALLRNVYDDRIDSRIACGTWFELNAPDRRIEE